MHPRVSVSQLSSVQWSHEQDMAFWAEAGVTNVGLWLEKLERGDRKGNVAAVADAGLRVTNLVAMGFQLHNQQAWAADHDRLLGAVDTAVELGAECMLMTPGTAGTLPWEDAADAFAAAIVPVREAAAAAALPLGIEHTNPLRAEVGFVHSLHDAIDLARRCGIGVLMEINNCWAERGLAVTIARAVDTITLVQVDDWKLGTHMSSSRAVVGDGIIPLDRIMGQLIEAGYPGVFDLEILGAAIEEEGYASAIGRSLVALERLLDDLGVER